MGSTLRRVPLSCVTMSMAIRVPPERTDQLVTQ